MTSISQERSRLAKVGMRLRRRSEWGSRFNYNGARSVREPADHQFVHITVTNAGAYTSEDAHARAVEAIGRSRFPNTGGSYNRLAMQSGRIYELQPIGRRGAHTVNDKKLSRCSTSGCPTRGGSLSAPSYNLNYNARAYAIAQNVHDKVTAKQLDNLARAMAADRLAGFVKLNASVHGHRCVAWKDCPGGPMWRLMGQLEKKINQYVKAGLGETLPDTGEDDDMPYKDWPKADREALLSDIDKRLADDVLRLKQLHAETRKMIDDGILRLKQLHAETRNLEVRNPVTGKPWPLADALWSMWYYSLPEELRPKKDDVKAAITKVLDDEGTE